MQRGVDTAYAVCIVIIMLTPAKIQKIRRDRKETQGQFARHFGVDQSTISRWEKEGVSDHLTCMAIKHLLEKMEAAE